MCWALIVVGSIVLVQGLLVKGEPVGHWAWRPIILVSIAATAFALLIEPAGLVISMIVLMIFCALAGEEHTLKEFTIFSVIMVVLAVAMFIWGLGMPLKVFPWS